MIRVTLDKKSSRLVLLVYLFAFIFAFWTNWVHASVPALRQNMVSSENTFVGQDGKLWASGTENLQNSGGMFDFKKMTENLPQDLTGAEPARVALARVADRSLSTIVNSDEFKHSHLGLLNNKVKEQTTAEMVIKTEANSGGSDQPMEHRITSEFMPFQGQAQVSYRGYVKANLLYTVLDTSYTFEVKEKFFSKELYFQNHQTTHDVLNQVGMRWIW